jgi:hypothetical protein
VHKIRAALILQLPTARTAACGVGGTTREYFSTGCDLVGRMRQTLTLRLRSGRSLALARLRLIQLPGGRRRYGFSMPRDLRRFYRCRQDAGATRPAAMLWRRRSAFLSDPSAGLGIHSTTLRLHSGRRLALARWGSCAEGLVPRSRKGGETWGTQRHPSKSPPFRKKRERMGHPRDPSTKLRAGSGAASARRRETKMHRCFVGSPSKGDGPRPQDGEGRVIAQARTSFGSAQDRLCPCVAWKSTIGGRDARQTAGRMPALRKIPTLSQKARKDGAPAARPGGSQGRRPMCLGTD